MEGNDDFGALLQAAQNGDDRAVAVLYRDLHPRLFRYLGAREPRAADDLEAEVWLAVAKGIAQFSGGEEPFRAWVFSIARRRLADYRRTAARRATVPVPNEELDRAGTDDPEAVVLEDLSSSAAAAFVVATLSPDQAEIVLLRVIGGLTVDQVAELLGKRPGTVLRLAASCVASIARGAREGGRNAMTYSDDPADEMAQRLSMHDAERLLSGEAGPGDFPDGAGVARLLTSMRTVALGGDLDREHEVVATISAEIRGAGTAEPASLARARGRRVSARAAAIAFAAVLASGTAAAAAANGSLPPRVQRAVSSVLAHVNISVPRPQRVKPANRAVPDLRRPGTRHQPATTGTVPARAAVSTKRREWRRRYIAHNRANGKGNGKTKTTHTLPPQANGGNGTTKTTHTRPPKSKMGEKVQASPLSKKLKGGEEDDAKPFFPAEFQGGGGRRKRTTRSSPTLNEGTKERPGGARSRRVAIAARRGRAFRSAASGMASTTITRSGVLKRATPRAANHSRAALTSNDGAPTTNAATRSPISGSG